MIDTLGLARLLILLTIAEDLIKWLLIPALLIGGYIWWRRR